jgi:hypothetical protein
LILDPINDSSSSNHFCIAFNWFCPKISLAANLFWALEAECAQLAQIPELCFLNWKSYVILLPGCSEIFKKCFYSIFELSHNNMRSFIVAIVYMHRVFFEQLHLLHYFEFGLSYSKWWSPIPFLFLQILFFFMAE